MKYKRMWRSTEKLVAECSKNEEFMQVLAKYKQTILTSLSPYSNIYGLGFGLLQEVNIVKHKWLEKDFFSRKMTEDKIRNTAAIAELECRPSHEKAAWGRLRW